MRHVCSSIVNNSIIKSSNRMVIKSTSNEMKYLFNLWLILQWRSIDHCAKYCYIWEILWWKLFFVYYSITIIFFVQSVFIKYTIRTITKRNGNKTVVSYLLFWASDVISLWPIILFLIFNTPPQIRIVNIDQS
jgi:hypothetical protein